jgi:hypothetical protein
MVVSTLLNTNLPELPYHAWRDTCSTLHLWTQIVGKVRLAQTPWLNHGWHVPLYVNTRGLTTSSIPHGERTFEIQFDFRDHVLAIDVSDGTSRRIALRPRTVADFHEDLMASLADLALPVAIRDYPCEIADAVAFTQDRQHASYDAAWAQRFWRVLMRVDSVFKHFRTGFIGKASPVHFFWGSFDLAVTRFSGRPAPPYRGAVPGVAAPIMREAYSHEVSSAGFWPGSSAIDYPCFYSYAYPEPAGFRAATVQPAQAFFNDSLGEFLLPYDAVREASDPEATLMAFLQSTYEAAARAASWNRSELECSIGVPRVPRQDSAAN